MYGESRALNENEKLHLQFYFSIKDRIVHQVLKKIFFKQNNNFNGY
jgi:hypothetical protein